MLLVGNDTQKMQGIKMLRCQAQHLRVQGLGLEQLARLMQGNALLK
jgi:hypothetical protein